MNLISKIKDKLHLTTFHKTMRIIKKLKTVENEKDRLKMLEKFLTKVKNKMYLMTFSCDVAEFTSWEEVYSGLEYFSDRWNLQRVCRLYGFIQKEKWKEFERDDI